MKTALVWFKNDLRLHDNEALCQAIAQCEQVVCCFCVETSIFEETPLGFRKSGINRFRFLEQSVLDLQKQLEPVGVPLIITSNGSEKDIPELVETYGIDRIFAEREYASEELKRIKHLKTSLPEVAFNFYWGKTLYHLDDIPFSIEKIPLTSKAYRIPTSKESTPRVGFKAPEAIRSHPGAKSNAFPSFETYGFDEKAYNESTPFLTGGETEALSRLRLYTFESQHLTNYRWTRNKSQGLDYSSKFSPYLALGCLSPRTIYETVKAYEAQIKRNQSTWWLIFELVWRDYFTFKGMKFGDLIFKTEGFKNKQVDFENDRSLFKRWQDGHTGIPFIDAHMRQLNQTGYMSNRGRVNCASYLVQDLKIDWTWGAAYFECQLIDYDVSSNWMNWHMQAYEIYYTNPVHQSLKYKAEDYIAQWIPELAAFENAKIHAPWLYPEALKTVDYPEPIAIYPKWSRAIARIEKAVSN